jgi:NADP-dependent 3-hydroxy acid dehydrogenase YdfG
VLDVTDPDSMQSFVAAAHDRFGRIDVLVNNAGVMPLSRLDALRTDEWNRMIDVNLRGVLHGIAAVLPIMQAQHCGHIVNIASVSGLRVDRPQPSTAPPSSLSAPCPRGCARRATRYGSP